MKTVFIFFLILIACGRCFQVSYENFVLYRVVPKNDDHLNILQMLKDDVSYTFWNDVSFINKSVDIMVPSSLEKNFKDVLKDFNYHLRIQNVQELIENTHVKNRVAGFDWNYYYNLKTIYNWLTLLSQQYPEVSLVNGGVSYENRTILGVKISFKAGNKIVFLEGGVHAREWISPATVTYILNQILTNTDPKIQSLVRSRNWYVFPSINPDGYHYSTTKDRMWRKNRKPYGSCFGADLNRNWAYHWMHGGASNRPCADAFAGSGPFSEIETKSLSRFISGIANKIEAYIGFHSFSQVLMIPFGHAGLEVPPNNNELKRIGNIAAKKLAERYGTQYKVGNIAEIMYVGSGGSADWVLGTYRHIKYVFTFELRDRGQFGFLLPPNQIIPSGKETFDAVIAMLKEFNNK